MQCCTTQTQGRMWDQSAALSTDGCMKKYIYAVEFYPVVKRKKTMASAGKWIEVKITVLNEISQTREDKYVFSHSGISLGFVSSIFLHHLPTQSHSQSSITLVSLTHLSTWVTLHLPRGHRTEAPCWLPTCRTFLTASPS